MVEGEGCWVNRWGPGQKRGVLADGGTLTHVPAPHLFPSHPSESLYQLLSQTSPENMHRNLAQYGLDPATRYPNLNLRAVSSHQVSIPGTLTTLPRWAPSSRAGLSSRPAQSYPPVSPAPGGSACLET